MIEKGWVEELDKDAIPNIINLADVQKHPGFDPDRKYSLPWQSGMTGIAYNPKLTKPILSIDQLLEDKSLKGQITVLNSFADTLGLVMLSNGDDPSKVTDASSRPRSTGSRPRPTTARSASSPGTNTPARSARATSRPASPGRATSSSSCRTTRT